MPEAKRFTDRLFNDKAPDEGKPFSSERQHTAQAFNLHVERRDGRRAEGFAWSHYVGYEWKDEGDRERLIVVFGVRALEIEGHHLGVLVDAIKEGKLNGIEEMATSQSALLAQSNPENQPVISSVKSYPDFERIPKDIKGEDEHDAGFTGKVRGR